MSINNLAGKVVRSATRDGMNPERNACDWAHLNDGLIPFISAVAADSKISFESVESYPNKSTGLIEATRLKIHHNLLDAGTVLPTDINEQIMGCTRDEIVEWSNRTIETMPHPGNHILELIEIDENTTRIVFTVRKDGGLQQFADDEFIVPAPINVVRASWQSASGAKQVNNWDLSASFSDEEGRYQQERTWVIDRVGTFTWKVDHRKQANKKTIPYDSLSFKPWQTA